MAKTASNKNKPSATADEALQRQKKQARREAKLMLEIEEAKKDLQKAEKKFAKAQAGREARSTNLRTLEASLAELRAPDLESHVDTPPQSARVEHPQGQSELESDVVSSNGEQLASPEQEHQVETSPPTDQAISLPQVEGDIGIASSSSETETSTSTDEELNSPLLEEATPLEAMVENKDMTEAEAVQDKETAPVSDTSQTTTPARADAQKTAAARKSTATRRSASRSRSTNQSTSDTEHKGP